MEQEEGHIFIVVELAVPTVAVWAQSQHELADQSKVPGTADVLRPDGGLLRRTGFTARLVRHAHNMNNCSEKYK
jgi:hypothetical protein